MKPPTPRKAATAIDAGPGIDRWATSRFGRTPPSHTLPVAGLALSLLMHALLLMLPTDHVRRSATPATSVMRLTLRRPSPARSPGQTAAAVALRARPAAAERATERQTARPPRIESRESREPESTVPPPASPGDQRQPLDADALRAQAREYAQRPPSKPLFSAGDAPAATGSGSALIERPQLDALARRIGQRLQVTSEQRLPDGSWRIRFAGGVCMHVPRELPAALNNAFGPNIALATNCSD